MNSSQHVDPAHFLKSFFVVALHYLILLFSAIMSIPLVAKLGYPDVFRLWSLPENQRHEFWDIWENSPETLFPFGLCVGILIAVTLFSLFIGLQVAFWAPFSKGGHGIFLAILMIVTYLQVSITTPQVPKALAMGLLVFSSGAVVLASQLGERWFSRRDGARHDADPEATEQDESTRVDLY